MFGIDCLKRELAQNNINGIGNLRSADLEIDILTCSFRDANAFAPLQSIITTKSHDITTHAVAVLPLKATNNDHGNDNDILVETRQHVTKAVAAAMVAGALWAAPAAIITTITLPPLLQQHVTMVAQAKEMASGSGSRVNKDPESLLRYGLPINNKEVSTNKQHTSIIAWK